MRLQIPSSDVRTATAEAFLDAAERLLIRVSLPSRDEALPTPDLEMMFT